VEIEKVDTWLGVVQKIAVISGLLVSAWIFLIKEETSPHVKMISTSEVMNQCVLRVGVQVENKGGRAWMIENAIVRVFKPDFNRIQDPKNLKELEIGTQIMQVNQSLRVGEVAGYGFNLKLLPDAENSFAIVKVAMKIKEEGAEWMRLVEEAVPIESCK